jgi:hypothetical protein
MKKRDWPTREQWAKHVRTLYFSDVDNDDLASSDLHNYLTDEDTVEAAISELQRAWSYCGQQLKHARQQLLVQGIDWKPKPTRRDCFDYFSLSAPQQALVTEASTWVERRHVLHATIKNFRCNLLDYVSNEFLLDKIQHLTPIYARIKARYAAAQQAELQALEARIAQTPIDDAAWEEELQRRREFDRSGIFNVRTD